jgi:catechol 2,3-dioxygenase-like lactoylglutathione lyase family enzyme
MKSVRPKRPGSPASRPPAISRRRFVARVATAGAVVASGEGAGLADALPNRVRGFDHVALPMRNTEAMLAFYRSLGFEIRETAVACSIYVGGQMINFHRPTRWQDPGFTLRASAAQPPCGDLCFVWDGTPAALKGWLDGANVPLVEGPVARPGGRKAEGTSVYVRDPDGNCWSL